MSNIFTEWKTQNKLTFDWAPLFGNKKGNRKSSYVDDRKIRVFSMPDPKKMANKKKYPKYPKDGAKNCIT